MKSPMSSSFGWLVAAAGGAGSTGWLVGGLGSSLMAGNGRGNWPERHGGLQQLLHGSGLIILGRLKYGVRDGGDGYFGQVHEQLEQRRIRIEIGWKGVARVLHLLPEVRYCRRA